MDLYAIRVFVHNWKEACDFYRDTLHLTETLRDENLGWAEFDVGGASLGIERVAANDAAGSALIGRFLGVTLKVDDIERAYADLSAMGVRFDGPPEKQAWGGTLAHFSDLEGNVFTLME